MKRDNYSLDELISLVSARSVRECLEEIASAPMRDEAAVRTALMMGADFVLNDKYSHSQWTIKGIDHWCMTKAGIAWLYLATHGMGIDKYGSPKSFKEIGYSIDP